jgi:hypothetical protein
MSVKHRLNPTFSENGLPALVKRAEKSWSAALRQTYF